MNTVHKRMLNIAIRTGSAEDKARALDFIRRRLLELRRMLKKRKFTDSVGYSTASIASAAATRQEIRDLEQREQYLLLGGIR